MDLTQFHLPLKSSKKHLLCALIHLLSNFGKGQAKYREFHILYVKIFHDRGGSWREDNFESVTFSFPEENQTVEKSEAKPVRLAKHSRGREE